MSPSQVTHGDYTAVHATPDGPGDSRPTAHQIVQDEDLLQLPSRLSGKTVLITGGTSGLGLEVAKALHPTGARIFITGRCGRAKDEEIAASINTATGQNEDEGINESNIHPVRFVPMDLSDLSSVRDGANSFLKDSGNKLSLLICNAGVMAPQERTTTAQDHEMQFGVNHLAHFLLFKLLCPALLDSSTEKFASRVTCVSSCAHRGGGLVANGDYDFEKTKYDPQVAYGQSKTANIYMANELERRFGGQGLHGLSVHPGVIMETGLVRHMTDDYKKFETQLADAMPGFAHQVKNSQQGAASIVWAAVATKFEGKGGMYLEDCGVGQPVKVEAEWFKPGTSSWCYDKTAEERLWRDSGEMLTSWL